MNFKTTYILFGVLVGLMGVFLLTQLFGPRSKEQHTYVLPSLHDITKPVKADDIDRIEIERIRPTAEKLSFYRDEFTLWRLRQPNARAESSQVNRIIDQVMRAKRDDKADLTSDLSRFGLDSPSSTVTLFEKGTNRQWTLNLGDISAGDDKGFVYVTSSDIPKEPMAVKRSDVDVLFKGVTDFRSKNLAATSAFDVNFVKLQLPKKDPLILEKSKDGKWRYETPAFGEAEDEGEPSPPEDRGPKTITGMRDLTSAVADLRVETDADFGPTDVPDAELAEKGLSGATPETLRVEVKRQPGFGAKEGAGLVHDVLLIGKKVDDKGEHVWARLESERNLVKLPTKKVDALVRVADNPAALRNRDLVQLDQPRVDAIDIDVASGAVKLRKTGTPADWKLIDAGQARDAEDLAVQNLLSTLTARRQVREFPDSTKTDADLGLDKPTATISIWIDGIKPDEKKEEKKDDKPKDEKKDEQPEAKKDDKPKDEKKDASAEPALKTDKPNIKLVFGKRERDLIYVRREVGSDVTRVAVPTALADKATEGKLAYLDRKLPSFPLSADVSKIAVTRGKETLEIDKIKDDKGVPSWKLAQPKELAGRSAEAMKVDHLISELRDLRAEKLIAEKPSDADLERYGLKAPAVKAVITETKGEKKEEHVYLFGKDTDDKAGIYAKQGERDLVFVVRKSTLEPLQGDFRDSTALRFDLNKLKSVKMTGWQDIIGSPYTLELERKAAGEWVAKTPADFSVDGARVEGFITGLTNLRATRFIGRKADAKPDHKLATKEGSLEIVLTIEGEKEPLTLVVGGAGEDGSYATSSQLGDDLFLIPKDRVESAKSKPAYFRKD